MTAEDKQVSKPPTPPQTINVPGLIAYVEADTMGEILEEVGDKATEYGEGLGYLHQLANKIGETLAFDRFRSLHAKSEDAQFYSEQDDERHIAMELESNVNLQRFKKIIQNKHS